MNDRIHQRLLAIATVSVLVAACGGAGSAPSVAGNKGGGQGQNRLTLTIATGEGDPEEAQGFATAVADVSNGEIEVKVDNTTIAAGKDPAYEAAVIKQVAAGKAELGVVAARVFDTVGVKSFVGLQAPFLIDSYELEERVLSSAWAKALLGGTRSAGVVGLGYFQGPMRRPLGLTRNLVEPSDYAGARIGVRASALTEMTMQALGATPIVFNPGDTSGLDGMEVHMGLLTGAKYDEGAKSMTGNVMFWPRPGVVFANSAAFDGLTPNQQAMLRAAADKMYLASVLSIASNSPTAVDTLCARGLEFVSAPVKAVADLRAAVQPVYDEIVKDAGTKATIDAIEALRKAASGSPEAVVCGVAAAPKPTAVPSFVVTPLSGTYTTSFSKDDLAASPLLYDQSEVNNGNWGDFTLSFDDKGHVAFNVTNPTGSGSTSGTYSVDGDLVTLAFKEGANYGETFTARWSLYRDTLTFERAHDKELPTPYLIKSWTRQP